MNEASEEEMFFEISDRNNIKPMVKKQFLRKFVDQEYELIEKVY
jgi:hypothetical protein